MQGYNEDQSEFYQSQKTRKCLSEQREKVDKGETKQLQVECIKVTSSSAEDEEEKEPNNRITV